MTNLAIIVGNVDYDKQNRLPCCANDVEAMYELINSTAKFDLVLKVLDADADKIKEVLRENLSLHPNVDEIFFYFTGHGWQGRSDFFFCPTSFDAARPNETGLSNDELHTLFRLANPKLIVKVVDACNSGNPLIKSAEGFMAIPKGDLRNVIQIASCLNSQNSLTGDPLSEFTDRFCRAALRKHEGPVFYTDITNTLRDDYIDDEEQTPHFVSQGTGREVFVDDASRLDDCRKTFETKWFSGPKAALVAVGEESPSETLLALITSAEESFASPDTAKELIDSLFNGVIDRVESSEFSDFFEINIVEHSRYQEMAGRSFVIRSLLSTKRPDNFVVAAIDRKKKKPSPFDAAVLGVSAFMGEEFTESWVLELNCSLPRVQMKVVFTPKFSSLNQMTMVLTCAPSLNKLYVFEFSTQNLRVDWDVFEDEGREIGRHWYSIDWDHDPAWIVDAACKRLLDAIRAHLDQTSRRLAED